VKWIELHGSNRVADFMSATLDIRALIKLSDSVHCVVSVSFAPEYIFIKHVFNGDTR
jgi:hypothetical protein